MSPFTAMLFLNTANVIYVLSYGVRDVLWLRILAVLAMLCLIPYYLWGTEEILFQCIFWQAIFIAINVGWIYYLIKQRQPPKMTSNEKRLFETLFRKHCTERQMLRLLESAESKYVAPDTALVKEGLDPDELILIDQGDAVVRVGGKRVAELGSGDFVAEMSYLTGKKTVADVFSLGPLTYLVWKRDDLERLFEKHLDLNSIMNQFIGRNLVSKITA
ncbi:MAG: cyclic nucleotide-binding domain-containing protein, partial [Planctomycetota bacterium]